MATELSNVCASQLARTGGGWDGKQDLPGSCKKVPEPAWSLARDSIFDLRVASSWEEDWGVLLSHRKSPRWDFQDDTLAPCLSDGDNLCWNS